MKKSIVSFALLLAVVYCHTTYGYYDNCPCPPKFFVSLGWGCSWSTETDIDADPSFWDPALQGYGDDLSNSPVYAVGLGYNITSLLSLAFELSFRPEFRYKRFQDSTAAQTVGFLGEKTRYFRLSNWAYLFNLFLNRAGNCFQFNCCKGICLAPFIGAGIGIAYNTVDDFHSIVPSNDQFDPVHSIMVGHTETALAGQLMAGFVSRISQCISLEIGYRRFHGGRFLTNNYTVDVPIGLNNPVAVPPWKGYLNANEIYLSLNYSL